MLSWYHLNCPQTKLQLLHCCLSFRLKSPTSLIPLSCTTWSHPAHRTRAWLLLSCTFPHAHTNTDTFYFITYLDVWKNLIAIYFPMLTGWLIFVKISFFILILPAPTASRLRPDEISDFVCSALEYCLLTYKAEYAFSIQHIMIC